MSIKIRNVTLAATLFVASRKCGASDGTWYLLPSFCAFKKTTGADSYLIGLTGWPHFSRDEIRCVFLALKKKESDSLSIGLTGWSHFSRDEIRCVFPTLKKYGVKFPVFHAPWPPCLKPVFAPNFRDSNHAR